MLSIALRWLSYTLLIIFISWIVPGIEVDNFISAMLVCIVIALIDTFIKPLLEVISLPLTYLTSGLFYFVINALLFMLAGAITPGFEVENFLSALLGSVILSFASIGIDRI
ncbi:phage holin family protein [bacterium]|nr:phage holin family protein [bacterium]